MNRSNTLTPGQKLLKQATKELDDYFTGTDGQILRQLDVVVGYTQTLAILELIKTIKKSA